MGRLVPTWPTKVIETTEVIPEVVPPTPQSESDARKEAVNAYAQWKIECRGDAACLNQARADYNAAMKKHGYQEEKRLHCHGQGYENVERPLIRNDETMLIAADMNIGIHPIIANARVAATISDNFLTRSDGLPERLHQTAQKVFEI